MWKSTKDGSENMKEIKRNYYLQKLIKRKENGRIKIITGIRRCGKSYLLNPLFKNYLLESGVDKDHIINLDLDYRENKKYHNPDVLFEFVMEQRKDDKMYYVLLDEIQEVEDFESVLNSFLGKGNLDVYVTGSNSRFLSNDIKTEFRGRGDEIRIYPLSYQEFFAATTGSDEQKWNQYITYGGMPYILSLDTDEDKSGYLKDLFENTYLKDIIERNNIYKDEILDKTVDILSSSVGSLTNPKKIADTFTSQGIKDISHKTINAYINFLLDSFMITKAERYDIKGRKYITTPSKYYFVDIGLRNARLNFRQIEQNHLMENIIYNELLMRGYNVDVGVVEQFSNDEQGKTTRKQLEIDFVCNQGSKRYYIQSALNIDDDEKKKQELRPLLNVNDFFKKIIIVKDDIVAYHNEEGILIIGIKEFLLKENIFYI